MKKRSAKHIEEELELGATSKRPPPHAADARTRPSRSAAEEVPVDQRPKRTAIKKEETVEMVKVKTEDCDDDDDKLYYDIQLRLGDSR